MRKTEQFRKTGSLSVENYGRSGYLTAVDAEVFLSALASESADLIFLDPPFNLGKRYQRKSKLEESSQKEYLEYMTRLMAEVVRVLRPGGAVFLYHLPYWAFQLCGELQKDLDFRHWIAVSMKNGFVRGKNLYPAHYALVYFTKGTPQNFNRPKLAPKTCRHCGDLVKDYGGYTNIIRSKGINLSDVWEDLSPVRHQSKKLRSANQLPIELTNRVIGIAGIKNGVFVDPFVGTGTSLISAVNGGMNFIGNDISKKSLAICRHRLAHDA